METQLHALIILRMETLFHDFCPDTAGSTELRHLFENVVVCVPEEGQTASEIINLEARFDSSLAVSDTISNREGDFLCSRRTGLTDMIAGNGDRIPFRYIL